MTRFPFLQLRHFSFELIKVHLPTCSLGSLCVLYILLPTNTSTTTMTLTNYTHTHTHTHTPLLLFHFINLLLQSLLLVLNPSSTLGTLPAVLLHLSTERHTVTATTYNTTFTNKHIKHCKIIQKAHAIYCIQCDWGYYYSYMYMYEHYVICTYIHYNLYVQCMQAHLTHQFLHMDSFLGSLVFFKGPLLLLHLLKLVNHTTQLSLIRRFLLHHRMTTCLMTEGSSESRQETRCSRTDYNTHTTVIPELYKYILL